MQPENEQSDDPQVKLTLHFKLKMKVNEFRNNPSLNRTTALNCG